MKQIRGTDFGGIAGPASYGAVDVKMLKKVVGVYVYFSDFVARSMLKDISATWFGPVWRMDSYFERIRAIEDRDVEFGFL